MRENSRLHFLKKDLKKYTSIARQEDVIITKNGKPLVKLVSVSPDKQKLVDELAGCIRSDRSYEELMKERYSRY